MATLPTISKSRTNTITGRDDSKVFCEGQETALQTIFKFWPSFLLFWLPVFSENSLEHTNEAQGSNGLIGFSKSIKRSGFFKILWKFNETLFTFLSKAIHNFTFCVQLPM